MRHRRINRQHLTRWFCNAPLDPFAIQFVAMWVFVLSMVWFCVGPFPWCKTLYFFSSSQHLEGPPSRIPSRHLADHLGVECGACAVHEGPRMFAFLRASCSYFAGVERVKTPRSLTRATKKQRHLQFHKRNARVSRALRNLTFILLSKHSVETSQQSGKKNANTQSRTRNIKWKVLVFYIRQGLSNQDSGLGAALPVCIPDDKPSPEYFDPFCWQWMWVIFLDFENAFPKATEIIPKAIAEVGPILLWVLVFNYHSSWRQSKV